MRVFSIIVALVFCAIFGCSAQIKKPVVWSYGIKRTGPETATVYLKADIDPGWHIYSTQQEDGGPEKTAISFTPSKTFTPIGKVSEPKPISKYEEVYEMQVMYFTKSVIFEQKMKLLNGANMVQGKISYMVCTNKECLPPETIEFKIPIK